MRRPRHLMPADVEQALRAAGVVAEYSARPSYQQNDYVGWIMRARLPATRRKRIAQMLGELERGGVYMNMVHRPSAKPKTRKPPKRAGRS